ncbi:uncharacterized protein SEPMUDRAFT_150716 [Sphaerulina musiva SO2202]|uniref:Uncharacterized protein n=1 Tax=Sphaerulina musiva (strain SO2202) TaxID=692275 RepID=N1QEB2_SPHMS|nr:uncharacterized protein SEPMUDRAFT_150716 [Sphaerulina musiva SO2202]EMF10690.1 hypothetical protein SEPMUDRAFT_150716 [Sphaerulina musiva SO2202]
MLVTQGATQDPPFVCTPLEMAPSTKKRFQREQIQTKRYRDMVIAYATILELLQKSPLPASLLARVLGITPHQARYRMSLIQEDVTSLKQAFVDGKCQVGRPTRKSPTKKSPRVKGETVPSKFQAAPHATCPFDNAPHVSMTPSKDDDPFTPYWSPTFVWTPGLPWPYEIYQTPMYNTGDVSRPQTPAADSKFINPQVLTITNSTY